MGKMFYTPEEAAPILGIHPSKIRQYMRNGTLDLGLVMSPQQTGTKNWRYIIYPAKLNKITGAEGEKNEKEIEKESGQTETGKSPSTA